ncbi:ubiquinol-cytochrome c reductase iron-sulfur subunit [Desertibaculum subflavum]|uniref:ubiquinol-cytochrome c reductase iron-sulfur subunit n=1 Tax=Desertibaculum subflavum TaxID=2268458 RepID=UPI000E666B1B
MSAAVVEAGPGSTGPTGTHRDFLYIAAGGLSAVGAAATPWPFIDSMNPSADILALSLVQVDLPPIQEGQRVTVMWSGRPVFVCHRSAEEVARSEADDRSPELIDPATDASRVKRKEWLIVLGVCTHLGCVPLGQSVTDPRGRYGGWFCPCHGSVYDGAGRVRRGPAPRNLEIPSTRS